MIDYFMHAAGQGKGAKAGADQLTEAESILRGAPWCVCVCQSLPDP